MRQLIVQVPRGQGQTVVQKAASFDALNVALVESAVSADGAAGDSAGEASPSDLVLLHLSNRKVDHFLRTLEALPDSHVSFFPQGAIALQPPASEAPEQVKDVEMRSPLEVFLAGVQSIGAWTGLLGFAVAAGAIVWTGLFTNTIYLLTAAMLVAPFAGPAMNTAIATAMGDARLLRQSLLRYAASIAVTVATAAALSFVLQHETATAQMIARSQVSAVAVLLPLVAGFAGALSLTQSDGDNLVSGAAVGILVAASLAPPAGLVGMAAAIGRWDLVVGAAFVLLLQLAGINFVGALTFRLFGLAPGAVAYKRLSRRVFPVGLAASALVLAALLAWQFAAPPALERASLAQRAATEMRRVVEQRPDVALVEAEARFTRTEAAGENTLLGTVYVQRRPASASPEAALSADLARAIQQRVQAEWPSLTPLVSVTVLEPPPGAR